MTVSARAGKGIAPAGASPSIADAVSRSHPRFSSPSSASKKAGEPPRILRLAEALARRIDLKGSGWIYRKAGFWTALAFLLRPSTPHPHSPEQRADDDNHCDPREEDGICYAPHDIGGHDADAEREEGDEGDEINATREEKLYRRVPAPFAGHVLLSGCPDRIPKPTS